MNLEPAKLERYAFLWSIARLVIAAFSLFFGVIPIAYQVLGSGITNDLLPIFWLVSGVAAVYLLYLWYKGGMKLFGQTNPTDKILFLILSVTGINLGLTAIIDSNIGINLAWNLGLIDILVKVTAIVYLFVAYRMYTSWKANGESLFGGPAAPAVPAPETPTENQQG
jgi:hypothetical protein